MKMTPKSMEMLLIRHCEDEKWNDPSRECAERWSKWHSTTHIQKNRKSKCSYDPCLTENGCLEATTGCSRRRGSYGGVKGGLLPIVTRYDADVVFCSPLSRAIQTAIMVHGSDTEKDVQIIVHPVLKEIKPDVTYAGRFPKGKPSCVPLPFEDLRASVKRCSPKAYSRFDWSALKAACDSDGYYFDAAESYETMKKNIRVFLESVEKLTARGISKIAVITHGGVIQEILQSPKKITHGSYAVARIANGLVEGASYGP